ncbi:MAG: cupin domain-containing protein [Candidatus Limivicinus sp.]
MYSVTEDKSTVLDLPKRTVKVFVGAEAYKSEKITMGKTVVEAHTDMDPHTHETQEEIVFVIKGTGEAVVGGSVEPMAPNTAVVFPAGVEHVVRNTGDCPMEFVFMFNPTFNFGGRV